MPTGYSRAPKLLKGALIEFSDRFIASVPNVIVFQYNPEKMTRTLAMWGEEAGGGSASKSIASGLSQPYEPTDDFKFTLMLNAADDLENPTAHPVAFVCGLANRIAAIEMLLYPQSGNGLLGDLSASLGGVLSAATGIGQTIPPSKVPVVLFAWGPGRIVPVRITSFSLEEEAYSPSLYPIEAQLTLGLKVMVPKDAATGEQRTLSEELAVAAYNFTRRQTAGLAASNAANSVESILAMLPF